MKFNPTTKNSKNDSPKNEIPKGFLSFLIMAAGILIVLFYRSFDPSFVLFANDGPLGQEVIPAIQPPGSFLGVWRDLNSLGNNAGSWSIDITTLIHWIFGPLYFAKFYVPSALLFLGISAWYFFRQMKFSSLAAISGGLAAMLVSASFSDACWGTGPHEIAIGMDFCALGLFARNATERSALKCWLRLALAGLAVGMNVMEGADIGVILSVFVALFVFFKSLAEEKGAFLTKMGRGIARVAVIAIFAGFIAAQTISSLVGTVVVGIAGTSQDEATKARQWDFATQWSLPKRETLGLIVPGLFGYRMDTPQHMMPALQDAYSGGNYWGGIGRTPVLDRYFDSGSKGTEPSGPGISMRWSGAGEYVGILVMLVAIWAIAQSFRRQDSVFSRPQKKFIWLGAIVLIFTLLMSWGRFASFYQFFYALPYASTIRNPAKFIVVFTFMTVILFGYGVDGLGKLYLQPISPVQRPKNWWTRASRFDKNWTLFSIGALICGILGWAVYASEKSDLIAYLGKVGFPDRDFAEKIASFSIGQVGWFILFFALSVVLMILIIAGFFSGKRARLGGVLLGVLLVLDLGRANLPWIIDWNYIQKYEIGALNPVVKFLTDKPYEHRVAQLASPPGYEIFGQLYGIEWIQQLFPYYDIQSLDKVQEPREPVDQEAFERTVGDHPLLYWQLTNTRYLLGAAGFLDALNNQLDPGQKRFRIIARFDIVPKPGVEVPYGISPEQYVNYLTPDKQTAQISPTGKYALFEFTGALPRAKLYTDWQTNSVSDLKNFSTNGLSADDLYVLGEAGTNGFLTLKKLASPSFDPEKTVLLDAPLPVNPTSTTNQNSGTVEFKSYAPKRIIFTANAVAPSVLLFNDKYDPGWHVTVDGSPAPLFRANFIMRGVFLPAGEHTVEFRFTQPHGPFYITLSAVVVGILLIVILIFLRNRPQSSAQK